MLGETDTITNENPPSKNPPRKNTSLGNNDIHLYHRDEGQHKLKIRHPDTEDDRGFGTKVAFGFIAVVTIGILLTPTSRFKKIEDR